MGQSGSLELPETSPNFLEKTKRHVTCQGLRFEVHGSKILGGWGLGVGSGTSSSSLLHSSLDLVIQKSMRLEYEP